MSASHTSGAIEFFKACKDEEIKPILGQTTFVAGRTRKQTAGADNPTHELVLLAQDAEGFANLRTLSSLAFLDGFSYRPRRRTRSARARAVRAGRDRRAAGS